VSRELGGDMLMGSDVMSGPGLLAQLLNGHGGAVLEQLEAGTQPCKLYQLWNIDESSRMMRTSPGAFAPTYKACVTGTDNYSILWTC
jgi:hypothetical protein